jgi:hypothetical protein
MPDSPWSHVVPSAVVPVVVISACGLLCLALYNRLAAVVARLRFFERERLEALVAQARTRRHESPSPEDLLRHDTMLPSLDNQIARVMARAVRLQKSLIGLLTAVAVLLLSSLCSGLGTVSPALQPLAVVFFALGLLAMLVGVLFALGEMLSALEPVRLEALAIDELAEALGRMGTRESEV